MALKLGKCRLCLKLGDFYSIFTVDNSLQLAEMAMECAQIKIYDGDGLPDKICSECIQKLSSAYIFKQQCERADQELRRNYVPPPGFSISPPPPNRQSSDSAFSTHTDSSNLTKPSSSIEEKISPAPRNRKRSIESVGNTSTGGRSSDFRPTSSKRVEELRNSQKKRPRLESENNSQDSDYEDNSGSGLPETDSDEPLLKSEFKCKSCPKHFTSYKSLAIHTTRMHGKTIDKSYSENVNVATPKTTNEDAADVEDKLSCEKCGKTFKLKIMLKRHADVCGKTPVKSPQKELLISLEPIDAKQNLSQQNAPQQNAPQQNAPQQNAPKQNTPQQNAPQQTVVTIACEYCTARFKTLDNLAKHMKIVHAAVLKREAEPNKKVPVPCLYCNKIFNDYYEHNAHFGSCPKLDESKPFMCPVCDKVTSRKTSYYQHIRNMHFEPRVMNAEPEPELQEYHECRVCLKKLASQEQLIKHLSAHVSDIQEEGAADNESRASMDDAASVQSIQSNTYPASGMYHCPVCDKEFKYKKALATHKKKFHTDAPIEVKIEPPDKASTSLLNEKRYRSESESSQEEEDNTCDICEKRFSYKRLLIHHKRTKHNMSSGHKRAKIYLKDCLVRCLICDLQMKVGDINEHNQKHIAKNMKPRNLYTCGVPDCEATFKACSALATHIKLVHRLKRKVEENTVNPSDFCEVVVTKSEPLDWIQSHNDFGEVPVENDGKPLVDLSGFTCPICGKKMPTLISLKRHVNWHTNVGKSLEKKYECFVCKESFRFQCHYKLHMREHYTDTNLDPAHLTCAICGRKSKHLRAAQAHMNFHKQTRFKNKDYQCSICERVFQYRKVYLSHMAIHYKKGDSVQNTIVGSFPSNADNKAVDSTHTCHHCGKVCDSANSLKCHLSWHSSKTLLYGARHECNICKVKFTNKRSLELHHRTHFEDENGPFKCNICGKGYTDEGYFKRHVKGHNFDHQSHKKRLENIRKDKVKCPICSRYYKDLVKLIRHLRRTHPESKMIKTDPDAPPQPYFSCKLCAKMFLDERRLQAHEEAHLRKPEFFKCKFCGKKTISLKNHRIHIKGHLTQKYIDNPLKCPHCDETFGRGYDLHYHVRDVHGIEETWIAERSEKRIAGPLKDLQCSICMKVLASKGNFERHLDYHNSLRCNYCFDYFSSLRFLEGHLSFSCEKKKRLGDTEIYAKKIKCHICYKPFHIQVKLDCHLRTQHDIKVRREASSSKKEIVCDYCFKVFENEYALSTHKVYHRTIGYFGCIYCKRKFNTMTLYRKHKNHHFAQLNVDEPTKCEHCDETFVAFRDMIYHMRDVHGDDKDWVTLPKESIEETCKICNKTFYNLHRHLMYHEENRCKKCGEYFFSTADCDNHLCPIESDDEDTTITENGFERPKYEECNFCFKPITRVSSRAKHDHIHKGSGSISCRFCWLKFKTMDAFNIHAFSHRSRKYNKKPIKCKKCKEKFVKYGLFMKHMKNVHKSMKKMHYRAMVKPEPCVVCGEEFPNLHNHYRAHLMNQCQSCKKYFTSVKLFAMHECDKEDSDPSKVFTCDANLNELINSYVPKDLKDDEKYYGNSDDEEEEEETLSQVCGEDEESQEGKDMDFKDIDIDERDITTQPLSIQSPIISDVLSLYQKEMNPIVVEDNIVNLTDDDSDVDHVVENHTDTIVIIDDDD